MRRHGLLPLFFILLVAFGSLAATVLTDSSPQLGLDLQGGVAVVLQPRAKADAPQPTSDALDQTIEIIRTRVDALGVAEPEITRQGDSVIVQLPGVKNQRRALDIVGQTAELRFRPVLTVIPLEGIVPSESTTTTAGSSTTTTSEGSTTSVSSTSTTAGGTSSTEAGLGAGLSEGELAAAPLPAGTTTTTVPASTSTTAGATTTTAATTTTTAAAPTSPADVCPVPEPDQDVADATLFLPELDDEGVPVACYQVGPSQLTGSALQTASAELDPNGQWQVAPKFKSGANGIDLFNAVAAQCFQRQPTCPQGALAIVLDGVVKSAPTIQQGLFKRDEIVITGQFSEREAKDLALVLRYGALPIELEPQTVQTVSASLGDDSLRAGIAAGLGGLALVAIYMLAYYRALGVVVIVGLAVWGALNFSLISYLSESQGLALSLAGVTGIIVSVGVTVDSYVVYFERLKDEVRAGRTLRSSTDRAFRRAFRTILAADISSFIGAALLYWLTVGPVRGFAFFLGLSTILDVAVAWFFTRPMVNTLSRSRTFTDAPFMGVARGLRGRDAAIAPVGGGR